MEDKYYTPVLDEFIQGFKFEVLILKGGDKIGNITLLNSSDKNLKKIVFATEDVWVEAEVWWKKEPEFKSTTFDGITVNYKEYPKYDWTPWVNPGYIEKLINEGKIRCKYDE